jgi:hypothetical protein
MEYHVVMGSDWQCDRLVAHVVATDSVQALTFAKRRYPTFRALKILTALGETICTLTEDEEDC